MNKPARFLIVFIVILAMILFVRINNLTACAGGQCQGNTVGGKAIRVFTLEPTAIADLHHSTLQRNLIFLEFFSGL